MAWRVLLLVRWLPNCCERALLEEMDVISTNSHSYRAHGCGRLLTRFVVVGEEDRFGGSHGRRVQGSKGPRLGGSEGQAQRLDPVNQV